MHTTKRTQPAIQVTKSTLPDKAEYMKYLDQIWEKGWLTNNGPLVNKLEERLKSYLSVSNLQYVTNGTIALQLAIKSLELKGEIITTPYSYVASTSSIIWEGCTPVFADIKRDSFTIDPAKIEERITEKTTAILATHVYGIPCDVDAIAELAKKHNIKIIYDAAHAFGVKFRGRSLYSYGDISATSFHATKVYHTIEGGAVISNNEDLINKIALGKAFGHSGDQHFQLGINGKNSEFHAAIGLCNLDIIEDIIFKRKLKFDFYKKNMASLPIRTLEIPEDLDYNYGYFPVVFDDKDHMMSVKKALENENIFPRRYFYPSLNTLPYVEPSACPQSQKISNTVLCLPFYHQLEDKIILKIIGIIQETLRNG